MTVHAHNHGIHGDLAALCITQLAKHMTVVQTQAAVVKIAKLTK